MGNLPCAVFFCIFSIESQKGGEVIMVREASLKDLNAIEAMIKKVVLIMQKQNNPQWDQEYPARKDFQKDIEEGALYVWEEKEKIRGVMCVNFEQPDGYRAVKWIVDKKPAVIHRLAVDPEFRGRGIGKFLFSMAEEIAEKNGIRYIRTDTYRTNREMNGLMLKMGYCLAGHCRFPGKEGDFNCYEKLL